MDAKKMMMQKRTDNLCERLENVKRKLQHTYEHALLFEEDFEKMKRERDALMHDLYFECYDSPHACYVCKHGQNGVTKCKRCLYEDNCFEWRGLCKENGGIEE